MLIKRVRSVLYEWRNVIGMVVWDIVIGAALIFFLYIALLNVDNRLLRVALMSFTVAICALSIAIKYVLYYRKTGIDDVTGGKNKKEFERIASTLLQGTGKFALVYANIDRFKLVNELYGNERGDDVLRQIHKVIDDELVSWDEVSG
ncbi:MAG: diguanylate cyclase, partial [Eubacterium sp.]|nr:diguanylate cyclase [Eubacterium sp.]